MFTFGYEGVNSRLEGDLSVVLGEVVWTLGGGDVMGVLGGEGGGAGLLLTLMPSASTNLLTLTPAPCRATSPRLDLLLLLDALFPPHSAAATSWIPLPFLLYLHPSYSFAPDYCHSQSL